MGKYNTNDPEAVAIRKKIEKLQSMNPEIKIYDVISKEDVELFEYVNDVKLPEDYKWFITNVGNGGTWRDGEYRVYPLDLDKPGFLCEELPNRQKGREKFAIDVLENGCTYFYGLFLQGAHFGEVFLSNYDDKAQCTLNPLHGFKEFYLKWLEEACLGYDDDFFEYTLHGTIEAHLEQYQKNPDIALLSSIFSKVTPQCASKQFVSDVHRLFVSESNNEHKVLLARILLKAGCEDPFSVLSAILIPENYETIVWALHDSLPYFAERLDADGVMEDAPKYYPMLVTIMRYYETAKERVYCKHCFEMTVMNPLFKPEDILGFLTSDDAEIVKCLAFVCKDNIKKRVGAYIDEAKIKYERNQNG